MVGCGDDDLKLLIAKNFLIPFESGVVVIKHWKIHNYIRNDRYKPTVYKEEKSKLYLKDNNAYTLDKTLGIPSDSQAVYQRETQVRDSIELGKVSIGDDNSKKERNSYIQIIKEYTADERTIAAILEYIAFFQAQQGCFIMDSQLRQFLDNCEKYDLLFAEGLKSFISKEGIEFALMEK